MRLGPRVTCFALYWSAGQLVQPLVQPTVQSPVHPALFALQASSSHPQLIPTISQPSHSQLAVVAHVDPVLLRARRRAGSAQGGAERPRRPGARAGRAHHPELQPVLQPEASCRRALLQLPSPQLPPFVAAPILASFGRALLGSFQPLAAGSRARWTSKPRTCPGHAQAPFGCWTRRPGRWDGAVDSPSSGARGAGGSPTASSRERAGGCRAWQLMLRAALARCRAPAQKALSSIDGVVWR